MKLHLCWPQVGMERPLVIKVLDAGGSAPTVGGRSSISAVPSSSPSPSTDPAAKGANRKDSFISSSEVEAVLGKQAARIATMVTRMITEETDQQKKQPPPPQSPSEHESMEATRDAGDVLVVRWRDEHLIGAVYKGLKRPRPVAGPDDPVDTLLSSLINRVSTMVAEEVKRQLADWKGAGASASPSTGNVGDNLFTTLRRAVKGSTPAGVAISEKLLEHMTPRVTELIMDVAVGGKGQPTVTAAPSPSQWRPFGGGASATTKTSNGGNSSSSSSSSSGDKQGKVEGDGRKSSRFGTGLNVFAKRKSSAATSRRGSDDERAFPRRGKVREHLVRLGIIAESDAMRAERRTAMDVAAMEEQQKRMKDLAGRFWSKADDERAFIRQTFDAWRVDIGGTELKLDGRTITEAQWPVLEDVFEVSPHYRFSSFSMKRAYLKDEVLARMVPMLECNTQIKKVDWCKNELTDQGMELVVELLRHNRSITELDVRENSRVKADGGYTLYQGLSANKTLRVLNGIPVRELQDRKDLLIVDLSKRRLNLPEAALLSRLLTQIPSTARLTTLDLRDNVLSFRALDILLPAFAQLLSLHTLDISGNKVGVEGTEGLAYFLHQSKTLTDLRMADCDATKEGGTMRGIEAIEWVLACRNTTLLHLDLSSNQANDKLLSRIQDSLRVNRSLTYESGDEFERFILGKLPAVQPSLPVAEGEEEAEAARGGSMAMPVFDEQWLRREKYVFRTFVIEPDVEVVSKKKRKMMAMMMMADTQRQPQQPQPQQPTQQQTTAPRSLTKSTLIRQATMKKR